MSSQDVKYGLFPQTRQYTRRVWSWIHDISNMLQESHQEPLGGRKLRTKRWGTGGNLRCHHRDISGIGTSGSLWSLNLIVRKDITFAGLSTSVCLRLSSFFPSVLWFSLLICLFLRLIDIVKLSSWGAYVNWISIIEQCISILYSSSLATIQCSDIDDSDTQVEQK